MYKVVDLFAGAGGLSLGFMQTRKYDIKVAFENSPYMQETYRLNHPGVEVQGDVCAANYDEIKEKYGDIDVVIGGPPCQGFSNANRQKNHAISQNNMLVKQYIRAILELKPKAFVMENVSMLKSDVHRFYMEESDIETVAKYKIPVKSTYLISDMEFNACVRNASVSNFASAKRRFAEHGYRLPQIVFWNVASRNSNQPVTKNEQGVALVSGCTPRLFSMVTSGDLSPYSVMMEVIESERYAKISA